MHPMFVKLYLEAEADDDEADRRRRANRARRQQITRGGAGHRPRP